VWIGHVVLQSRDALMAARFFEQIGMRAVQVEADLSVLEMRGGTHIAIRHDPEYVTSGPVGWDLMVDDLDASHARWETDGLAVTSIVDGPPHRWFQVTDPDGHVLVVRDSHVVGPV
jgi:hypothetical protein